MDKIWLKAYPEGIPDEIDPNCYQSISELFGECCQNYAELPSYSNFGHSISYQELLRLTDAFASYLVNELKLAKGERVAIMMPNLLQYPVAMFGVLQAALVVVNINPLYTPRELKHQINDAGCSTIIILSNMAHLLEQVLPGSEIKNIIITQIGDLLPFPKSALINFIVKYVKRAVKPYQLPNIINFNDALHIGSTQSCPKIDINGDDIAFLQYTGGTTGISKGAILTQRNIIANLEQASSFFSTKLKSKKETFITALPLYHIFSLTVNCLFAIKLGAFNILITNPRDMPNFIKVLKNSKFTIITGVNTLFNGLMQQKNFQEIDFSTLKVTIGGGTAIQAAVAKRWAEKTMCTILEGYGLTETSPCVCVNPTNSAEFTSTIGVPLPSTDISIRDENEHEVAIGKPGELCIKGPQVMKGYWQRDDETKLSFTHDGYFKSGDIAILDERGFVKIVDRKKDMILVSGFNVYPNEIENVIAECDAVLEVACVGVQDEETGEAVKVFIVKKPNAELTEKQVDTFCRQYLTAYKIPKYYEFIDELPKSNVGKILRRKLR